MVRYVGGFRVHIPCLVYLQYLLESKLASKVNYMYLLIYPTKWTTRMKKIKMAIIREKASNDYDGNAKLYELILVLQALTH